MKINIYPIVSKLHNKEIINTLTKTFINDLEKATKADINIVDIKELYNADLSLILILSGGSEQIFLEELNNLKEPYYLLTSGNNNSLAASIEILSYLKEHNKNAQILHGDINYLASKIKSLAFKLTPKRLGVIGKPSDWLIASNVNYDDAKRHYNIELIDIDINEVIANYSNASVYEGLNDLDFDQKELDKAKKLLTVLTDIKKKYNLDGLTIRCFDLLNTIKTTACLSLAYLNSLNIVAACEGDIPTMISMYILNELFNSCGFQANPSRIDVINSKMVLAHCTLPLNMTKSYTLDTHFESGIGVAIRGKLKEEKVTIFKLSNDLKHYFITTGTIINNLEENNLCRTQIEVKIDSDIDYFLTRPYGNHHVIIYGEHKKELEDFLANI